MGCDGWQRSQPQFEGLLVQLTLPRCADLQFVPRLVAVWACFAHKMRMSSPQCQVNTMLPLHCLFQRRAALELWVSKVAADRVAHWMNQPAAEAITIFETRRCAWSCFVWLIRSGPGSGINLGRCPDEQGLSWMWEDYLGDIVAADTSA